MAKYGPGGKTGQVQGLQPIKKKPHVTKSKPKVGSSNPSRWPSKMKGMS